MSTITGCGLLLLFVRRPGRFGFGVVAGGRAASEGGEQSEDQMSIRTARSFDQSCRLPRTCIGVH